MSRIGPLWTPNLTFLVLRHNGREHAFTSLFRAGRATASVGDGWWSFATGDRTTRVTGRIEAPRSAFVVFPYPDPPGGVKYCLNTKLAAAEVSLHDRTTGQRTTLHSRHSALFELLDDVDPRTR